MYSVYIHTFPNGKKYVGVTSWKPELRWGANGCNYKNPHMVNAIKKYGWNNITHEIVAENLTVDQASKMEIELIKKYNSIDRKCGYNISPGGIDCKICSVETKEKLRKANLGKTMSEESKRKISKFNRGRHYSEEIRKHMSDAQKKNFANGNNAIHSPEVRAKVAKKLRGRKLPDYITQKASEAKYHPVENMQTGVVYPSIKAACEDTGIDRSTIIRHCNGKLKKQKWKYAKEEARMNKSVKVIDSKPSASKKGLRIKVESVELDENNNLLALHIDYSGLRERGGGIVEVAQRNKFYLPEE